jgi:glycosyltransferase involved in cell wall biosynthesis
MEMGSQEMNKPLVSVILPTYNRGSLIQKCVSSVIAQIYENWELMILDDYSWDSTEETANELCKADKRITYHKMATHSGLPRTRNYGINNSRGQLIFLIEDDLTLQKDCISILVESYLKLVQKNKVGAIAPTLINIRDEEQAIQRRLFDFLKRNSSVSLDRPCTFDPKTGITYFDFRPEFGLVQIVEDIHACSMYPADLIKANKGFNEEIYIGNYAYAESDLNYSIKRQGYSLFFEPKAITFHKSAPSGGCKSNMLSYSYYSIRNHYMFLMRNFKNGNIMMVGFLMFTIKNSVKYYINK